MGLADLLHVRVLSLASAVDRRVRMSELMSKIPVVWSFFDALDGVKGGGVEPDQSAARHILRRNLFPGEVGCFRSHRAIWQEFVASDRAVLWVLEDDVDIDHDIVEVIQRALRISPYPDYLKLCAWFEDKPRQDFLQLTDHRGLVRYLDQPWGTQSYLLSRKGAQRLIDATCRMVRPIDHVMDRFWSNGLPCLGVFPPVIREAKGLQSSIASAQDRNGQMTRTWGYRWSKRLDKIGRKLANWRYSTFPSDMTLE